MDEDELQDDLHDGDEDNEDNGSGSDNSAPPSTSSDSKPDGKRVNDLMSKWQAEQARANRLERELAAARGTTDSSSGEGTQGGAANERIGEYEEFARENARNTLFNSAPELAEYGLTASDIAGSTLAEMRESLKKHRTLAAGIEGRARNKILAEHGLNPEVATGAGTEKAPSFSQMTDKEFADYLAERDTRGF